MTSYLKPEFQALNLAAAKGVAGYGRTVRTGCIAQTSLYDLSPLRP
jgi:hypothetical protein